MQVAVCDKVRRKHFKYETMRLNFFSKIEKYFVSFPNILFLKLLLLDTINLFSYQLLKFFIWDCLKKKYLFPYLFVFFEQVTWSADGLLLLYQYLDRFCIWNLILLLFLISRICKYVPSFLPSIKLFQFA